MDDEDGRCLLDVICDPQALNDFLHGSETQGHVPEVQPQAQLSTNEPGLPRVSVDLDFLEDDDILGGSPGGDNGSNGVGTNHEPCDILQQSLAEANITEQSLQEAEAELDLSSFGLTGLTQVVQPLPDAGLSGVGIGGATQIFTSQGTPNAPSNATPDMLGSVLAHPGLQLQPKVMNKAISVQPFVQQVGLGNVTLQPISSLQALPNGSQSGQLGIGQIQVVGQPTVMTINPSGQQILTKTMGGYQLHQPGPEAANAGTQAGLGSSVLGSGGGLLIQGGKATLGSPALNGPAVCLSNTNTNSSVTTMATASGIVGFGNASLSAGIGSQTQPQGQIMQNVIIQRTPTPIQPKPPQGGAIQPKIFKQQQQLPAPHALPNDANKAIGVQQIPVSAGQNVTFLTGKPASNVVLSTQAGSQGTQFSQALFKQQGAQQSGKPLSVHLLNQQGSIVIPSQTVLQGQNQFLLPGLQAGGQILAQHPSGHIITSQGPGGQIIANQILTANQNINLGQMLASQGHPGTAHILSGHIQLQPGQMGHPTLFQMPVSLAQTQTQAHPVTGHVQTVIQGMPIQNSLSVESLSPAVSLQTLQQSGGIPSNSSSGTTAMAPCQPGEGITVLGGSTDPAVQAAQAQHQTSILTVQSTPAVSIAASVPSSSSPSPTMATSTPSMMGLGPHAQHSPGKVLFTSSGSSMILSQESLQMFLQQEQQHQAGKEPPAAVGVPASVIVSGSSSGSAPSGHDNLLAETRQRQSPSPSLDPAHMATVVNKVPSAGHPQTIKIQSASPSRTVVTHSPTPTRSDSPQPTQVSPLTIGHQIQSPHQQSRPPSQPQPQTQAHTPSRSCTPSSLPPLFIIQNQIGGSPQAHQPAPPPQQQPQQIQVQLQPQVLPQTLPQPATLQPDVPPPSCSPKPPQPLPAQFQFHPASSLSSGTPVKQQVTVVPGLTADQQHHLQLVSAQLQTMSSIAQPSPQQKQLLEKLHQLQQNILLQAKQQVQAQAQASQQQATNQFNKLPDQASIQTATSTASGTIQPSVTSLLQQKSVLVKSSTTGANDTQVFSAVSAGSSANQGITSPNLTQAVQAKSGVISSVGGLALGKTGLQIQVLGTGLSQMPAPPPPAPVQTQTSTLKRPFGMEPSKEARMLEQLRKQQGSVLHPDYSSPFGSFEDTLHRLLPYHLYQGMASSSEDYRKVDDEFESVSNQLLKRTQAMLDKYRHLLFEESKQRLGPSAEMVMIDRMFIQEEKVALSQDRVLAKEKPEEFVASTCLLDSTAVRPIKVELSSVRTATPAVGTPPVAATPAAAIAPAPTPAAAYAPTPASATTPASAPAPFPPTKLVIKQGGGSASVSWSTSSTPTPAPAVRPSAEPVTPSTSFSRTPSSSRPAAADDDDDVTLPQRTSKPPIKTYEARRRIGLKLKIKQEAGFSKVVHNTALDPVHSQSKLMAQPPIPEPPQKVKPPLTTPTTVIRTPPPASYPTPSSTLTTVTAHKGSASSSATSSSRALPSSSSFSWSTSSPSTSTAQMNGTLEHHEVGGVKRNPASTATPPLTTCRLPLRKTYRENISPRHRPGVPGGGDTLPFMPAGPPLTSSPQPQSSSPQPERTVIASVKLERQGGHGHTHAESQGLAAVEDVLYRGIKNAYQDHPDSSDKEDEAVDGGGVGRLKGIGGKNRDGGRGAFRRDQHAPGPPSLGESSCTRDSSLPAKRCKSDSPDMDNASFSSGSPPPDDSLNEHLQCAIDSILNLQQGPPGHGGSGRGTLGRVHGANLPNQHQTHPSYRPPVSSQPSSAPMSQHPQGRGQNGNLVSQTHSR
ncbi:BRD4-interacting chromatin-remodeling complex-associated protein isoform X2 [Triplophysa rosa]|uniref:BRD4-interacting chromatin-remodeling complex-associated protein isoform X2 n=1 Tax=Triplophysa rosa TaxID=992332 RepID=UPI00254625FB|nr:BRD4-interacting chromatin-remodeling complex-associated protein isoform X2 [Triplophysa rosa]